MFKYIEKASEVNATFIRKAILELHDHGFDVLVYKGKTPEGYMGCFNDQEMTFSVSIPSIGKFNRKYIVEGFVGLFAHEYCHFLQWKLGLKIFKDYDYIRDFTDPDLYTTDLSEDIAIMRDLERDCERRVINLIDKGLLELNRKHYVQCANIYVALHDVMNITRSWWKESGYKFSHLRKLVPNDRLIKDINCLGEKKPEFLITAIKLTY
jgi:hypothetical protein